MRVDEFSLPAVSAQGCPVGIAVYCIINCRFVKPDCENIAFFVRISVRKREKSGEVWQFAASRCILKKLSFGFIATAGKEIVHHG